MRTLVTRLSLLALSACHGGPATTTSGGSSTTTTEDSSGAITGTSETLVPDLGDPDVPAGCLVEVWSWVHDQDGWNGSEGGLALAGSRFQAVGKLGGSSVTLAVTAGGDLAWGLVPLGGADHQAWLGSGVVGLASGDALTISSGIGGSWLERWSATGDSAGPMAIPGEGYQLGPAALAPDGAIVTGGFVGALDLEGEEAVLMALSAGGVPAWDIRLDHNQVLAVVVDPAGTIFVLAEDRYIEGGDVYLTAVESTGLVRWDVLAGSNTGWIMMGALTPFAVTPDGQGGAYTLGHQHHLQTQEKPASDERLLARYDSTDQRAWEARSGVPDVIDGGGLAVVSDEWVVSAVDLGSSSSLAVHRIDGTLKCEQSIPERNVRAIVAAAPGEVVLTGPVDFGGPAWFARYRVAPK